MSLLDKLFKREPGKLERVELISNSSTFTPWSGNAYSNDIYRSAVDAISRNAAKLKGTYVVNGTPETGPLSNLLQVEPNPYMSSYDLLYKLVTHLFLYNNAFAFIQRGPKGKAQAIYPIKASNMDFMSDDTGELFCKFLFSNGKESIMPYRDVIHLRRNFNDNDLLGDSNNALMPALELAHTQNEGLIANIRAGTNIRGILKYTGILSEDKLKESKNNFINDYLSISNSGGVVATDSKVDYVPIEVKPIAVDKDQIEAIKTKIYDYLGISKEVVNSSYSEDQWAAFYESTLEPIALQMSLEFSRKLLTGIERKYGHSIIFESGRLQFSSNTTKVNLIKELMPYGLLTINQALDILNLPGVEDGDKRFQTLNIVDAENANEYQLNKSLQEEAKKQIKEELEEVN